MRSTSTPIWGGRSRRGWSSNSGCVWRSATAGSVCAFQPKVDIRNQEVVGFETLVRWRDDDGEIHPPSSFVGLAIELGVIDPITHFVLAEALNSIEHLDKSFGPGTTISINVAAKQASDLTFMRSVVDKLKREPNAPTASCWS